MRLPLPCLPFILAAAVAAAEPDRLRLVADLNPGANGSNPRGFFIWDDQVWFTAFSSSNGRDVVALYRSDGSTEGTRRIKEIPAQQNGSIFDNPFVFESRLYFQGPNAALGKGSRVWMTDGTEAGTRPISEDGKDVCDDSRPLLLRDRLVLSLHGAYQGHGLAALDLHTGLTEDLAVPFDGWSDYGESAMLQGAVLTLDSAGAAFWSIDGTRSGLKKLSLPGMPAFDADDRIHQLVSLPGGVLMLPRGSAQPWEIWHTDGKSAVKSASWSWPKGQARTLWFGRVGDLGVLLAFDRSGRCGLWSSDGTAEGSKAIWDGDPYKDASFSAQDGRHPDPLVAGGRLYFEMDDGQHGLELWCSDGSRKGTQLVSDMTPGDQDAGLVRLLGTADGRVLVQRSHEDTGNEIWITDGTEKGTQRLASLGKQEVKVAALLKGKLLLEAGLEPYGRELWTLDTPD